MKVYAAIAAVQGELAKTGIAKDGQNTAQNYRFRGIDQVYGALSPLLAKHGLCVLPRMIEREMHERVTVKPGYNGGPSKESVLFYVTVTGEFDFVAVEDGSTHTVRIYGEAMDSGDKATNKAMSAAYKYAAFMAFAIPTEGDNDADATTHDVQPRQHDPEPPRQPPVKLDGPYTSKSALWKAVREFDRELRACGDEDMLDAFVSTDESLTLLEQVKRDAPQLLSTGEGMPPEYEPIEPLIKRLRQEMRTSNPMAAG